MKLRKKVRKVSTLKRITFNKLVDLCKGKQVLWTASNSKTARVTHALVYARRNVVDSIPANITVPMYTRLYVADSGNGSILAYVEQRRPTHTVVYLISE